MDVGGIVFLFVLLGLIAGLLAYTGGCLNKAQWFAFLLGCVLLSGIVFWHFTGSTGTFTWKKIGSSSTGGATIGTGVILVIWRIMSTETMQSGIHPFADRIGMTAR